MSDVPGRGGPDPLEVAMTDPRMIARAADDRKEVAVSAPERTVVDLLSALEQSVLDARAARKAARQVIGSGPWLKEQFPDKDWHEHPRTDGRTDLCDGTPSDCAAKVRL